MVTLLYSEVNILCILILVLILHKVRTGVDRQNSQRIFLFVLVCNMIVFMGQSFFSWDCHHVMY